MPNVDDFVVMEEKLFGHYEVKFPINRDLVALYGSNGTGKTLTLEIVKRYFESQGENVIYFPAERSFSVTEEEVASVMMMHMLLGDSVFQKYGIEFEKLKPFPRVGDYIGSGFHQVINMFCKIALSGDDPIVLMDMPERSLHIHIKRSFIDDLLKFKKIKKLIVITHSPEVISNNYESWVNIENCINLAG